MVQINNGLPIYNQFLHQGFKEEQYETKYSKHSVQRNLYLVINFRIFRTWIQRCKIYWMQSEEEILKIKSLFFMVLAKKHGNEIASTL